MGTVAHAKPAERTRRRELARQPATAELRTRIRIGEKGRIIIPAAMRQALGMVEGEMIDLVVDDGELRMATRRERLRRAQEWARKVIQPGVSLADELNAERREAAKYE
ncbi:MAG TPA: AbrB/MazE/SpoVT family DNA-binding domain-containing protein [Terracidiphilus sp.]|jgi:AbrB family looped-hinge helix DNA binding protein|nr:AbrB/MazE/SpoVT family DNA-binding domain-containing protein [Terracidiphilus sp.]